MSRRGTRRCCDCPRLFFPAHRNHKRCTRCADKRSAAFFAQRKAGVYGRGVHIKCPGGCGLTYETFRSGFSFLDARRDFITDDPNVKTGAPRRHGRRHGVLGKMKEWKQLAWRAHIDACEASKSTAA